MLDRLSADAPSHDERQSIDLYRTLCLFAVGRRDDADRAIEAIIARDPLYRPADDLSPRMRTAFSDAKKRLLPAIVQQQYTDAKAAFERKEFEAAAGAFKRVIDALNDRDIGAAAQQPPLSDLRDAGSRILRPECQRDSAAAATAACPHRRRQVNLPPRIYMGDEADVRPPVTIAQELPRYPGPVPLGGFKGIVEVLIDETGAVESAAMVMPVTSCTTSCVLDRRQPMAVSCPRWSTARPSSSGSGFRSPCRRRRLASPLEA